MDDDVIKGVVETVATVAARVTELDGKFAQIQMTPGPQGAPGERGPQGAQGVRGEKGANGSNADPVEVARILVKQHADDLRGEKGDTGPAGAPGVDGKSVSVADVVAELVTKHADVLAGKPGDKGETGPQGEKGEKGDTPSVIDVATEIVTKHADLLKGERGPQGDQGPAGAPGETGKDADPAIVAGLLSATPAFIEATKGAPGPKGDSGPAGAPGAPGADGKDADAKAVAEILIKDHSDLLKGDTGPQGEPGPAGAPGADGKSVSVIDVAAEIVTKHAEVIRGEKGEKGDTGPAGAPGEAGKSITAAEVVAELVAKHSDIITGKAGEDGAPGVNGEDADPLIVAGILAKDFRDILRGEKGSDGETRIVVDTEIKAYEPGISRKDTLVTIHTGQIFRAIKDTAGAPDESDDWERVGSGGFRFVEGAKSEREGDLFVKDYSLWGRLGGKDRLLVGRPKVDMKHLAALAVSDEKFAEKLLALATDHAGKVAADTAGELCANLIAKSAARAVASHVQMVDENGRTYLVVADKAVDVTPVPDDVVKFVADFNEQFADPNATPVRRFHGAFQSGLKIQKGDLILAGNDLWQAKRTGDRFSAITESDFMLVMRGAPQSPGLPQAALSEAYVMASIEACRVTQGSEQALRVGRIEAATPGFSIDVNGQLVSEYASACASVIAKVKVSGASPAALRVTLLVTGSDGLAASETIMHGQTIRGDAHYECTDMLPIQAGATVSIVIKNFGSAAEVVACSQSSIKIHKLS